MQTLAGLVLDSKSRSSDSAIQKVLNTFLTLNILQFLGVYSMMIFDHSRQRQLSKQLQVPEEYEPLAGNEETPEQTFEEANELHSPSDTRPSRSFLAPEMIVTTAERSRGKIFFKLSAFTIFATWILFMATAGLEFRGST
jgi:hypothetical protein